jgi:ankyrin repeat protein
VRTACEKGHIEIVKKLLEYPNVLVILRSSSFFERIVKSGDLEMIRAILEYPQVDTSKGLKMACELGNFEVVNLLLEYPKILSQITTELWRASRGVFFKIVQKLLQFPEFDPTFYENSVIDVANLRGHHDIVKLLARDERVRATFDFVWLKHKG